MLYRNVEIRKLPKNYFFFIICFPISSNAAAAIARYTHLATSETSILPAHEIINAIFDPP